MPEIWFYHLQTQRLERVLPGLIQKSLDRGWRVIVQARSEERLDALDEWLWTFAEESFLAHGRIGDGDAELQPIFLATGTNNPNGAAVRFFIEAAEVLPALEGASYERVITLFNGADEDELAAARRQWKELKARGHALTYWQQAETGRWEKKA
jgi:DNA polymerase-3 subunit chi